MTGRRLGEREVCLRTARYDIFDGEPNPFQFSRSTHPMNGQKLLFKKAMLFGSRR